jgi:hypothetical protein
MAGPMQPLEPQALGLSLNGLGVTQAGTRLRAPGPGTVSPGASPELREGENLEIFYRRLEIYILGRRSESMPVKSYISDHNRSAAHDKDGGHTNEGL